MGRLASAHVAGKLFDQEACWIGDFVADPMIVDIVVAVEVVAAGFGVVEATIECRCSVIGVVHTQADLAVAALTSKSFRCAHEGCSNSERLSFG